MLRFPGITSAAAAALLLASCASQVESCGEYPEAGGPAVIRTRDQEVCEIVRLRVIRHLERLPELSHQRAETLWEHAQQWESARDLEALLARMRRDAGEPFAQTVEQAIAQVLRESGRPLGPDCDPVERCVARGAAKGARLALAIAHNLVHPSR